MLSALGTRMLAEAVAEPALVVYAAVESVEQTPTVHILAAYIPAVRSSIVCVATVALLAVGNQLI